MRLCASFGTARACMHGYECAAAQPAPVFVGPHPRARGFILPVRCVRSFLSSTLIGSAVKTMLRVWHVEQNHTNSPYRYSELPNDGKGKPVGTTGAPARTDMSASMRQRAVRAPERAPAAHVRVYHCSTPLSHAGMHACRDNPRHATAGMLHATNAPCIGSARGFGLSLKSGAHQTGGLVRVRVNVCVCACACACTRVRGRRP